MWPPKAALYRGCCVFGIFSEYILPSTVITAVTSVAGKKSLTDVKELLEEAISAGVRIDVNEHFTPDLLKLLKELATPTPSVKDEE